MKRWQRSGYKRHHPAHVGTALRVQVILRYRGGMTTLLACFRFEEDAEHYIARAVQGYSAHDDLELWRQPMVPYGRWTYQYSVSGTQSVAETIQDAPGSAERRE